MEKSIVVLSIYIVLESIAFFFSIFGNAMVIYIVCSSNGGERYKDKCIVTTLIDFKVTLLCMFYIVIHCITMIVLYSIIYLAILKKIIKQLFSKTLLECISIRTKTVFNVTSNFTSRYFKS